VSTVVTLDTIRAQGSAPFPTEALEGSTTALVLFAAAFHGKQDAIHIADAGLTATCVDTDAKRLGEMVLAYPEQWEYVTGDAFEYALITERQWDVVSVDCPTNLFDKCEEWLSVWTMLARRLVVLGTDDRMLEPPDGWELVEIRYRSGFNGGTYWAVLKPC
jgi:hypothetical protein